MKKSFHKKGLLALSLVLTIGACALNPQTVSARSGQNAGGAAGITACDDPGLGRLSGDYIPEEFYGKAGKTDINNDFSTSILQQYGSVETANQFTGNTYIHQDKFDAYSITNGIDVSAYQTDIDWTAVRSAGIEFAFVRVGYRAYGAGTLWADTYFDKNMDGAAAAGVHTGIYIFSQATTQDEAIEEAQYILDRIGTHVVDMPIVLDFEFASDSKGTTGRLKSANLSKTDATNVCLAFCQTIQNAGYTPMIYANMDMLNNHLNADTLAASYPIWLANYTTNTPYIGQFSYWQYASNGSVPGITGNVDMDFYYAAPEGSIDPAVITPIADQIYTGAEITPEFSVSINGTVLTPNIDYTAIYSNNVEVGVASIIITGINGYNGTRTLNFNILSSVPLPIVTDLVATKTTTKNITMSWSAQNDITGYELYRSEAPNGAYELLTTIAAGAATQYKDKNLTSGQCFYYKVRTYKEENGTVRYGEFSPAFYMWTKLDYTRLAVAEDGASIYKGQGVDTGLLTDVEENAILTVKYYSEDESGNAWYRIDLDGEVGFVSGEDVTIAKQGKVTTSKVNVRKKASITSKSLIKLKKGKKVAVIKTKTAKGIKWNKVVFEKDDETYEGWIASPYVKIIKK